jgi:hypothetical protein
MEDLDDAVIIDGFDAFGDFTAAGGASGNTFGQHLAAVLT